MVAKGAPGSWGVIHSRPNSTRIAIPTVKARPPSGLTLTGRPRLRQPKVIQKRWDQAPGTGTDSISAMTLRSSPLSICAGSFRTRIACSSLSLSSGTLCLLEQSLQLLPRSRHAHLECRDLCPRDRGHLIVAQVFYVLQQKGLADSR